MPADVPLDFQHMQTWIIPVVGLGSAGLALVMGRALFRRSAPHPAPPQAPTTATAPMPENAGQPGKAGRRDERPDNSASNLDPFEYGSVKERRNALRRTGRYVKVLVSKSESEEPEDGYIVDRSLGGICFTFPRSFPMNQELGIRAAEGGQASSWVYVRVKRCERKDDKEWEIGCQFVEAPNWGKMMQFG